MSALPPKADIRGCQSNVRLVPIADIIWRIHAQVPCNSRSVQLPCSYRAARVQLPCSHSPLPTHRHQGNRCFGWSDVPGYRCVDGDCGKEASRVAISVDLLRRVGILFVSAAYCDANVWRYFLFGAIFVRLRRERQALLRAREPPLDQKIEDQTEHRLEKMAAPFCKSARKSWTMKCAGSSQDFTMP